MAQARAGTIARYLTITCTQGSADAFVQGSVDTGIIPEQGLGLRVISIEFAIATAMAAVSADFEIVWSLTRDTKIAPASYNDDDCILFDGISGSLTTSGQIVLPYRRQYSPVEGVFLVEPTIYGSLDSTATGLTMTGYWRIYYEEVAMTEVDILRVLNNS